MAAIKHDSNTDIFKGQLFLFVDGLAIAYGKTASLNVAAEEVDISNKMISGSWKGSLPGQKSFTISSESLLTYKDGQLSFDTLLDMLSASKTAEFFLGQATVSEQTNVGGKFEPDTTQAYRKGIVMITSLDLNSTNGEIATCSASFAGVGALEKGEITPPTT